MELLESIAREALVADCGRSEVEAAARLEAELDYYRRLEFRTHQLSAIFRSFSRSLGDRGHARNVLFGGRSKADWNRFAPALCGHEPIRLLARYPQSEALCLALLACRPERSPAQRQRQLDHPRSVFRLYADGLLAGARYFAAEFRNGRDFAEKIERWVVDADMSGMLPAYFASVGIPGFGSALAADFLKELGVRQLGKPDLWVRRAMLAAGWIDDESAPAFLIQRAFWHAWEALGDHYPPVVIDKLMYVVGTGRFDMVEPVYACRGRMQQFVERLPR